MLNENEEIFLAHIPGYTTSIDNLFDLSTEDWRSRFVWQVDWLNLERIEVKSSSFEPWSVVRQGGYFGIEDNLQTDTARLNEYLDRLSLLAVDEFISVVDTGLYYTSDPLLDISVKEFGSEAQKVVFYEPRDSTGMYVLDKPRFGVGTIDANAVKFLLKPGDYFTK